MAAFDPDAYLAQQAFDPDVYLKAPKAKTDRTLLQSLGDEAMTSLPGGLVRGVKDVIDTGAQYAAKLLGGDSEAIKAQNDAGKADFAAAQERAGAGGSDITRVGGQVLATLPVGGVLGAGAKAAGLPRLANALASGGFTTGAAPAGLKAGATNMLIRSAGGGAAGYGAGTLIDSEQAVPAAVIGAALPPVAKVLGAGGKMVAAGLRGGSVSPEVVALAKRAKDLGIDIPADRLANSKPLNAVASGLNYVPFSGRAATEVRMERQLNTAASKLIGQNSDNMMLALRKAGDDLGAKFDATLKSNTVNFDKQLLQDIARVGNTAERELGSDSLKAISSQIDELVEKGASGVIDGQAAYNIKRTLDRIGKRNTPEAFHALELKRVLMGALDRSLGPKGAAEFATTRQQYGNMIALEKLARNGVDGEISVARLANMRNINNKPLQELADIAAQFVKAREGQHGSAQRALAAVGVGSMTGLPGLAGTAVAGRGANMLLNSGMAKNFVTGNSLLPAGAQPAANRLAETALPLLYRASPVLGLSR